MLKSKNITIEEAIIKEVNSLVEYGKSKGLEVSFSSVCRLALEWSMIDMANYFEEFADRRARGK